MPWFRLPHTTAQLYLSSLIGDLIHCHVILRRCNSNIDNEFAYKLSHNKYIISQFVYIKKYCELHGKKQQFVQIMEKWSYSPKFWPMRLLSRETTTLFSLFPLSLHHLIKNPTWTCIVVMYLT